MEDLALLIVRSIVGLLFFGHGVTKITEGDAFKQYLEYLDIPFSNMVSSIVILFEICGGILLILGLGSIIGPLMLISVMFGAIKLVHWKLSPWMKDNGYEYCLVLTAINIFFLFSGFGQYALDAVIMPL